MTYTFFGLIYPEYTLLPDTYAYIENGNVKDNTDVVEDFYKILGAKSGEIKIKSQLIETLTNKIDVEGKKSCQTVKIKNQKEKTEQTKKKLP